MAVSSQDILNFLLANPNMSDRDIATAMDMYGVTPAMMAQAVGIPVEQVQQRYEEVQPQGLFTAPTKATETVYTPPEPVYTPPEPVYIPEPVYEQPTNVSSEPQQTQEAQTMAVTSKQIIDFLLANPNMTDAQIATAMQTYNVTPAQMAQAVGLPVQEVQARYKEAAPSVYTAENVNKLADQILSQGTTEKWTGGLPPETAARYMADELAKSGVTDITQVAKGDSGIINVMTGDKLVSGYGERTKDNLWSGSYEGKGNTGFGVNFDESGKPVFYTQGASSSTLKEDVLKAAAVAALAFGIPGVSEGLLTGTGTAAGTGLGTGLTANAGGLGLSTTGAGLGALGTGAGITAGTGLGTGVLAGSGLGTSLLGAGALTGAGVLGGTTLGTAGTGASGLGAGSSLGTGITSGAGGLGLSTTGAGLGATGTGAGITAGTGLGTGVLAGSGLGTTLLGTGTGALTGTGVLTGSGLGTTLLGTGTGTGVTGGVTGLGTGTLGTGALTTGVGTALGTGLNVNNLANLLSGGLGTAGSLLQMQQSKEAADKARAMIEAETAAAKQAAQFRPIGMTTRFGTSQFQVDPVTGQLTSAGYTLSPEAKNAQDRLVKLAEQGLVQAEGAQGQFAPLQTGAQSLFNLGNQYLAQSPQDVAQNYLNQQMALLQPGRETELANLQNKLFQQGRSGVSVAQGGTYGATTPELQALYNARAMQEAQLAAQAQQAGQQQVTFGAGLLGQGASAMGQYYGGQQAAYTPYTTALGQVQGLETAAQQPFTMGTNLAQQTSTAGANVGKLGLTGAQLSTNLATSANATANPYAQALMAAGNPNAMFGQALGNVFGGLFS